MIPKQMAAALAAPYVRDLTLESEAHHYVGCVAAALIERGVRDKARAFDLAYSAVMDPFNEWRADLEAARGLSRNDVPVPTFTQH